MVTSPGGITAWLVSESFVPMVAMEVAWKGGGYAEPMGKDGAGWVLAYMMNEGAGDLDTSAYGARMQDLNMEFACGVWVDWTTCSMSTLKDTADESFDMMKLAFSKLRLDNEPLERAKREMTVNIDRNKSNPRSVASIAMNEAMIPGHAYARNPTAETVASISRADVKSLMQTLMTRDRLMVVVVGDITAEELKPRLDDVFGALPATSVLPDIKDAVAKPAPAEPIIKVLPQPQTLVLFSGPGVRRDDPDFFAAYLLNYILGGGGFSSRLVDDIREQRGLTYGIGTGLSIQPHYWRWTGSVSTMNDKADEVVGLVRENIDRLGKDGPTRAGTGRRQGLCHRRLPAGLRLQRQDRQEPARLLAGRSGRRLRAAPQFLLRGGDAGRPEARRREVHEGQGLHLRDGRPAGKRLISLTYKPVGSGGASACNRGGMALR